MGVRVEEADEEEGYVVLPRDPAKGREVGHGDDVAVAVLLVADLELAEVGLVVHVPAEDDGAEAEALARDGQELLLRHQLASQDAIDVDARHLDCPVVSEELGEGLDGDLGEVLVGHGGAGGREGEVGIELRLGQ